MAKMFYSIGEVAGILDIPVTTVRFWERSFEILRPGKDEKGHRRFSVADLENLKVIYHLVKERGMTLEGARQYLKGKRGKAQYDQEVMDKLLGIRALLVEIRTELGDEEAVVVGTPVIKKEVAKKEPERVEPEQPTLF